MTALREALERASRAAHNSEALATRARSDLQAERTRYKHIYTEWQKLTQDLEFALEENKRLRRAIGELNQERETLSERIRQLTSATPPPPPQEILRVVQPPAQAPIPAPEPEAPEMTEDTVVEFPDNKPSEAQVPTAIGNGFRLVMEKTQPQP